VSQAEFARRTEADHAPTGGEAPSLTGRRIVAIDGPAGAGKSTVAARIAERFGLLNLETGAMYRAFALKALRHGIEVDAPAALEALSRETEITLQPADSGNRVLLDGADVTAGLRDPKVTQAASRVSVHPAIRSWMVALQRALGSRGGVVMEGRDIGTAVFPDADVKVFLDASPEARSQRRYVQAGPAEDSAVRSTRTSPGAPTPAAVLAEMRERDERDRNRAQSPLRPAPDAIIIDSTHMTLDQVTDQVAELITARWAQAARR
jgi:cytidylate kinase